MVQDKPGWLIESSLRVRMRDRHIIVAHIDPNPPGVARCHLNCMPVFRSLIVFAGGRTAGTRPPSPRTHNPTFGCKIREPQAAERKPQQQNQILRWQVTIPADAGFVVLASDATVSALRVSGGALVTHDSTCLPGWTPAPGGTSSPFGGNKCYRVFDGASSWAAARSACAGAVSPGQNGGGALRGGLVIVQSRAENAWISRMCRGDSLERDCWVGLTRSFREARNGVEAGDDLEWAELGQAAGESRYRSWAVREPSDFESDEVHNQTRFSIWSREILHLSFVKFLWRIVRKLTALDADPPLEEPTFRGPDAKTCLVGQIPQRPESPSETSCTRACLTFLKI